MHAIKIRGRSQTPGKIICIGQNYVEHIKELGNEIPDNMVVFSKPASSVSDVLISFHEEPLHYEGEIALLIQAREYAAVAFGIDITKRSLQKTLREKGLPWERAKAFDGAAVFSEFVTVPSSMDNLSLRLEINGSIRQQGGTELMMYKPKAILQELRRFMTLNNGDIVMTGTPKGVGQINANDLFCGTIYNGEESLVSSSWRAS